ncbi:MAG: 1-acyl-sn-glycerol-3-phosphate acyltransferase [Candidatus Melainabacteria bacterium]|nr:1-acyl-sn-glycerol-3-phosphate acyltransferase [Candidatus Melainabacteria bacterium]
MSNQILIPPVDNRFLPAVTCAILPAVLKTHNLEVRASAGCVEALRRLNGTSTVVLLNHCDRFDPLCVFALSKFAEEDFHYLASREQFDGAFGIKQWLMQRVGAYSVLRGQPEDSASKEMTINLITEGRKKLIMFPEGDVTGRDDAILPLKEDGIRNMLEAQSRITQSGNPRSVYLLPMAIYYDVCSDAVPELNSSLDKIEQALRLPLMQDAFEPRITRVIATMLDDLALHYGVQPRGATLDQKLIDFCNRVSALIAYSNGIKLEPTSDPMVILHSVRGNVWRMINADINETNQYGKKLLIESKKRGQAFIKDLDRLEQLFILAHALQQYEFSLELAWRVIDRLELEITGKSTNKGHRIARFEAAPEISLTEFASYGSEEAVRLVDQHARVAIYKALQQSRQASYTVTV